VLLRSRQHILFPYRFGESMVVTHGEEEEESSQEVIFRTTLPFFQFFTMERSFVS
jgi:hypothetical protein